MQDNDMASLLNDTRQLFSEGVLQRYDRLIEAGIQFTFNHSEIYLSSFSKAFDLIDNQKFKDFDPRIRAYAQVFEHFVSHPIESVDPQNAGLVSAALYWLSGYSANSYVIAKAIHESNKQMGQASNLLIKIFMRQNLGQVDIEGSIDENLSQYFSFGDEEKIDLAIDQSRQLTDYYLLHGFVDEFISSYLLVKVLERLRLISFWHWARSSSSASIESWREYIQYTINNQTPVIDLWPSQRIAITKGLLDGSSSIVIRMPTSAGKTKMSELTFVNDLNTNHRNRCLYLAPYRALVSEVENSIGVTLSEIGFPVASLYGGSEANELEIQLSNIARVTIATPEKISAVLRITGGSLNDFNTIILDEGHLLDSNERGTTFELQLASLRPQLLDNNRVVFLSAVLPNSDELASWLSGTKDTLADNEWQPTTMRVGVVRWPRGGQARLDYEIQTSQSLVKNFFVPRLFEEDIWQEEYPLTSRMRTHHFPRRNDNGSIAAALAFQAAKSGPVIVYTQRPDWANSISMKILERLSLKKSIETNLIDENNRERLEKLANYLQITLGDQSLLPKSISRGFALHHSGIPQRIRLIIEEEFRNQTIRLLIATNTIAQGVNFPAKTIIVHSLPASESPIRDFWNLAGRAGRALKETEGEVIVLATGNLDTSRLNIFLNLGNIERAESRILFFVKELLRNYQLVSNDTIDALINKSENFPELKKIIRSIDSYLLEILAEDALQNTSDPNLDNFINNLFATHQALNEDEENSTNHREAINDLIYARRNSVITRVPNGITRKRYAQTGLSVDSSITLDESIPEIQLFFENMPELTPEAFSGVINFSRRAIELENQNLDLISILGYEWMQAGRYDRIFELGEGTFNQFDKAVKFTEEVLCFQTPWVLNGFIRLFENQIANIPGWFSLLPDFLRYGVNKQTKVWIMSLGFIDPKFADWLLSLYQQRYLFEPPSFRNLIQWIIRNKSGLQKQIGKEWPSFFEEHFEKVVGRYLRIYKLLENK